MNIKAGVRKFIKFILSCKPEKKVTANIFCLGQNELLEGKLALVTGGTSGIGKSIAIAFLKAGADVVITGRTQAKIDAVVADIRTSCPDRMLFGAVLDISNVSSLEESFSNILAMVKMRNIDILVNSAGVSAAPQEDLLMEEKGYESVMGTNLKGTYFLSKLVSKYMIEKHIEGNILNIASTSSNRPATNAYSISKWGIKGLTIGLAKTLIPHNIVVNGIAPGPTVTPMMKQDGDTNLNLPNNPSRRFAMPEEIGSMAVVLTSGIGRLVVGDIVYMGGGPGVITVDDITY